jgi:O-methyltransferase involved in polyketide biosynthesis
MLEKISTEKLTTLSKTMLITLYIRYSESALQNGMFSYKIYSEIIDKLDFDFSIFKGLEDTQLYVATRTMLFDNAVKTYINKNPDATIINIAAGMDARFFITDNGKINWFDVDLAEVIEIRKKLFNRNPGLNFITVNPNDYSWIKEIPKKQKILFIAEGLLLYFDDKEISMFFNEITNNITNSEIIFDVVSKPFLEYLDKVEHPKYVEWDKTPFKWGVNEYQEIEAINNKLKFVEEWFIPDYFGERCHPVLKQQMLTNPRIKSINRVCQFSF